MAHFFMDVLTGLFSLWAPDEDDDAFGRDPLASY